MKNKRKTVVIGIGSFFIGAAASAAVAAAIWNDRENKRLDKEINRLMDLKREIESFGEPTSDKVDAMSAYNIRTKEEVYIAAQCGEKDSSNTVWAVEGKNGLYLEYEYNLRDPFYYGD